MLRHLPKYFILLLFFKSAHAQATLVSCVYSFSNLGTIISRNIEGTFHEFPGPVYVFMGSGFNFICEDDNCAKPEAYRPDKATLYWDSDKIFNIRSDEPGFYGVIKCSLP